MKVLNNQLLSVTPDMTGTRLVYGESSSNYKLLTGTNTRTCRFVYLWTIKKRVFITSPYHSNSTRPGFNVPCTARVDITKALNGPNRVDALVAVLKYSFPQLTGKGYKNRFFTKV